MVSEGYSSHHVTKKNLGRYIYLLQIGSPPTDQGIDSIKVILGELMTYIGVSTGAEMTHGQLYHQSLP